MLQEFEILPCGRQGPILYCIFNSMVEYAHVEQNEQNGWYFSDKTVQMWCFEWVLSLGLTFFFLQSFFLGMQEEEDYLWGYPMNL